MPEREPVSNILLFSGREALLIAALLVIAALAIGVRGYVSRSKLSVSRGPAIAYLVPVNTATALELESLPGIGPACAKSIIQYRATVGKINSLETFALASGISIKQATPIMKYITLESPDTSGE